MKQEIIDLITDVTKVPASKIKENTNLVKDLDLDSLDLVELLVALEDRYNFEILDKDIKELQTINDIIKYVEDKNV